MLPDCSTEKCLFRHEEGCLDCRSCTYCGSVINVAASGGNEDMLSLLDAGATTVPACERCRASKGSMRLKVWLKYLRDNDPSYFGTIFNYNLPRRNTVSLIVRRVAQETRFRSI